MLWQIVEYRLVQTKPCLVEDWCEQRRMGVVQSGLLQSVAIQRAQAMTDAENSDEVWFVAEREDSEVAAGDRV